MRLVLAILLTLAANSALAQTADAPATGPDVKVRAYLEPDKDIYVGQLVRLWVEVTTSTWFAKAPRYPELQLDGAITLMPEQLGVNFTDRDGGATRTGQRQRYVIIPQRAGALAIPPLTITTSVSIDAKPSDPVSLQTEALTIDAAMPPGAEEMEQVLTTRKLAVEETYDREFTELKVGDSITRTITLQGEDTFALALPATRFPEVPGARAYPAQPILEDKVNRGQYRAKRIDSVTYVLERDGAARLPEIAVRWWNPDKKQIEEEILPSVELDIAANPDYRPAADLPAVSESATDQLKNAVAKALDWLRANIGSLTLAAIALYLLMLALRRFGPPLVVKWTRWRERSRQSEARFFTEFRRACRSGDTDAIVRRFWNWLDRLSPVDKAASLEQFTTRSRDGDFLESAKEFSSRRYGTAAGDATSASGMLEQVTRFRRRMKKNKPSKDRNNDTLNPRSTVSISGAGH